MRSAVLLAATAMLGFAAPVAATELIVNGGFEATGFGGTGTYYNIGTGGDNPVPGDFGFAVSVNNVDIIANGVYTASLGTGGAYNLDLVGYGSTGAISQSFATVLGKTYFVSLDYNQNGSGRQAEVSVNGGAIGTLVGSNAWQSFSTTFLGTGAPVTFAITNTVGGANAGIVLDNISVTAIPEPATWGLMLAGFALVGVAARRKTAVTA